MLDFNDLPNSDDIRSELPITDTENKNVYSITIDLYKYYGKRNELRVSQYLTNVDGTKTGIGSYDRMVGTLKFPYDFIHPTFIIYNENGFPWNYLILRDESLLDGIKARNYFVDNVICVNKNLYRIECTEDVLSTFLVDIVAYGEGFVERNENIYNDYIPDNNRVLELGAEIIDDDIYNSVFDFSRNGVWFLEGIGLGIGGKV